MTVAVAVARADDDRPRWPRRRGARRGGQVAVTGRAGAPAAGAPVAGGGGDGRGFQGREPRGGHHAAAAARGGHGGLRGGGGGAAGDAPPPPGAGRGRGGAAGGLGGADYADARSGDGGRDGGEHGTGPPIRIREDAIDWLMGNVNTLGESSRGTAAFADHYPEMNLRSLAKQKIPPEQIYLPFNEQELFENNLDPQTPEIDGLNDNLALLYESIAAVRRDTYRMMCNFSEAKDTSSYGKEIGDETRKVDMLIKNAEGILSRIKELGGEALPIPYHFYLRVKPLKP